MVDSISKIQRYSYELHRSILEAETLRVFLDLRSGRTTSYLVFDKDKQFDLIVIDMINNIHITCSEVGRYVYTE